MALVPELWATALRARGIPDVETYELIDVEAGVIVLRAIADGRYVDIAFDPHGGADDVQTHPRLMGYMVDVIAHGLREDN